MKHKRPHTIRTRLLSWTFIVLLLASVLAAVQFSRSIQSEMNELVDANLIQYANSLSMLEQQVQGYGHISENLHLDDHEKDDDHQRDDADDRLRETASKPQPPVAVNGSISQYYSEYAMAFQIWNTESKQLIIRSKNTPDTAISSFATGFYDSRIGENQWRVYVYADNSKQRVFMVAQEQLLTQKIINEILTRLINPMLMGSVALLLVFFLIIRRSLRPLNTLETAITKRSPNDLSPITIGDAPREISPVVQSLNMLMGNLEDSLSKERHFTSNAAHELRTPLAVIDTLTQTAIQTQDLSILPKIQAASDHARRQIEQLLILARLDANARLTETTAVDLHAVAQTVCADLFNIHTTAIDIQLHGEATTVSSTPEMMYILLKNIIENALTHTPNNGSIHIQINHTPQPSLDVIDSGTGIAPEKLAHITERFYRAEQRHEGFGIGLSIVQKICELHQAQLLIQNRDDGISGLRVRVTLPALHVSAHPK